MMAAISGSILAKLAAELALYSIKEFKANLEKLRAKNDFQNSLNDAESALFHCVPQDMVIPEKVRDAFFGSKTLENQLKNLLKGQECNLNLLEQAFYDAGYDGSLSGFNPRLAIAAFVDEFIQSAAQKEGFSELEDFCRLQDAYRRIYREQLVKCYENLNLSGMACPFDQNPVKLEEVFIRLQASQAIPLVDVLAERLEDQDVPEHLRHTRRLADRPVRETTSVLSVTEALKNDNLVVLGVPGSGKTTFMRYLALTFIQKLSEKRLQLNEDRLPILIRIQSLLSHLKGNKTIADVLSEYIRTELEIKELPDNYFMPYLEAGRCIVLFDGLDEVGNVNQRNEIAKKIHLFTNRYIGNRYVITSRIAGYREIPQFPESDFRHLTIMDLNDEQIEGFIQNWYKARDDVRADNKANDLIQALKKYPKVRQLATNPLMLTIIAIVHRSKGGAEQADGKGAELPNQRVKLYDICTESLIYDWQEKQGREPLTDVKGKKLTEHEVRRRLERLAYWMHSEAQTESELTHVRYEQLRSKLTDQLKKADKLKFDDAFAEATKFLKGIRTDTGVLLERGTELYAFVHLTFQEYFTACDVYNGSEMNQSKIWKQILPYLHDSHWQEVIRLLIAKMNSFDRVGQKFIERIIKAKTPYEPLLKRNLLLAGMCLADDVNAEPVTYQKILDEIIELVMKSPFNVQRGYAIDVLREVFNSKYEGYVLEKLLFLLSDKDSSVQRYASYALGSIGKADDRVIDGLITLLSDKDSSVQRYASYALGSIGKADDRVIERLLLPLLSDKDSSVRSSASYALGSIGKADDRVIDGLIILLSDKDSDVRGSASDALGSIGKADDKVIDGLITLMSDKNSDVRESASDVLGRIGKADDRVIDGLITLMSDKNSDVRISASYALGGIGEADDRVIERLLPLLSDKESSVRESASDALGGIGEADDRVIDGLITLMSDKESSVRWSASDALGRIGKADDRVINGLITLMSDKESYVRSNASDALGRIGKADDRIINGLITLMSDKESSVRSNASDALGRIGKANDRVIDGLIKLMSDKESYVRSNAVDALGSIGKADDKVIDGLITLMSDKESSVRSSILDALCRIGKADDRIIDGLITLMSDENLYIQGMATYSLTKLGKIDGITLKALENMCRDRDKYYQYLESESMSMYDWAFQALWRYAPSVADSSEEYLEC
jgi:HEAT repeat protein